MLTTLIKTWTRYRDADRRQLPLFPEWERARWLAPLPSLGTALGLTVLVVAGTPWTPSDVAEHTAALTEVTEETADTSADEIDASAPEYDLAAIPDHIKAAAERYQLSEQLIRAVISVESNFDHAAVSHKGARGLMQLMPKTAALIGVRDPHDPDENIDAGASHLRAMLDTFKGNLPLALAAYNAGEQHVVRHRGIPPFPETRRFVARVLRKMGDKKGAAKVLARPVPAPRWISRTPRRPPKVHLVSAPPSRPAPAPPTMIAPTPRAAERAPQLVLYETEAQPSVRTWSPTPQSDAPVVSGPTAP
ncbi:MAG: lytic transglycosylase domain-containing protein, partial [Candidatus Rokuibacteriota bacterium]